MVGVIGDMLGHLTSTIEVPWLCSNIDVILHSLLSLEVTRRGLAVGQRTACGGIDYGE